ncbi:MAG: ribosome biogenesis GTPase RsgA, partial [Gammaproteobacteria bacterium]
MPSSEAGPAVLEEGLVVSHWGRSLAVETAPGETVLCHTLRNLNTVAVGDRVLWKPSEGGLGCVVEVLA